MKTSTPNSSYNIDVQVLPVVEAGLNEVDVDRPIGVSGSSIFEQSTRNTSGPPAVNLPFEAIYSEKPERVGSFPTMVSTGNIGSPDPGPNYTGGLGSSGYGILPGFDKESVKP